MMCPYSCPRYLLDNFFPFCNNDTFIQRPFFSSFARVVIESRRSVYVRFSSRCMRCSNVSLIAFPEMIVLKEFCLTVEWSRSFSFSSHESVFYWCFKHRGRCSISVRGCCHASFRAPKKISLPASAEQGILRLFGRSVIIFASSSPVTSLLLD